MIITLIVGARRACVWLADCRASPAVSTSKLRWGWRTLSAAAVLNTPWKDYFLPASISRGGLGHEFLDDSMEFVVVVVR